MQNLIGHRLNLGKIQTALFLSFAAMLLSCNSAPKGNGLSSNPEIISIEKLNSVDTTVWEFHKSWSMNDTTVLVLAKSKYYENSHAGGPKAALVLITKTHEIWEIQKTKINLPIISSWGKLPEFKLEKISQNHILSVDYGYGSQGNDHRNLVFFDIDFCFFGEVCFTFAYDAAIRSYMLKDQICKLTKNTNIQEDELPYDFINEIDYQFVGTNLIMSLKQRHFDFFNRDKTKIIFKHDLEPLHIEYKRILCSWGRIEDNN
jgi:hypothetical protein